MKPLLLALLLATCSIFVYAQNDAFSYQAIVRDNGGLLITNTTVSFQISLLQTEITSAPVYVETHEKETSSYGSVSLQIGRGEATMGVFDSLNWENRPFFVQVAYDVIGGTNYEIAGTSELLSVPYALYARRSSNIIKGDNGKDYELAVDENGKLYTKLVNVPETSASLVITEIMANPSVSDNLEEWFEVYNYGTEPLNLNGFEISDLGANDHVISGDLIIESQSYLVLGKSMDTTMNGGIPVDYAYGSAFALSNNDDEIIIKDVDGHIVQSVLYDKSIGYDITEGKSLELIKTVTSVLDAQLNQTASNWQLSTCELEGGDFGTPGKGFNVCE